MKAATFFSSVLHHRRVVLASVAILIFAGLGSWLTMPRQEDPRMPDRYGVLVTVFPGSDTETMERLVAIPLEEELAQVGGIKDVIVTVRGEVAVAQIELNDQISDVEAHWDEVDEAVAQARKQFPDGVSEPTLNKRIMGDQEAIILAVVGSDDPLVLRDAARQIRKRLLRVPGVAEVNLAADPGVQVTVAYDEATAKSIGISAPEMVERLRRRNQSIPAGSIHVASRSVDLNPGSQFDDLEDVQNTSVTLRSGASVRLSDLAEVRREAVFPAQTIMRHRGMRGVGINIIADRDINIVALGERVRAELSILEAEYAPLSIPILSYQPDHVEERLGGLGTSLLWGIAIVALVLVVFMGARIGLLVAMVVPVVALISVALYAFGGGVLQQMSVAALILALGLLVDNAIVVVESAQHYLDSGLTRKDAAIKAARDLAFPLATATGTTIAAFVPMLLASGAVGDFTRAIPIVTVITLFVSYLFAVLVTPILASAVLRRRVDPEPSRFASVTSWIATIGSKRPWTIITVSILAVGVSLSMAGKLDKSFFPRADRDQFIVDVLLPEGSHLSETDRHSELLEQHLLSLDNVEAVSAFVGRSTPRFYYNLPDLPHSPHLAQLMIEATSRADVPALIDEVRRFARDQMPAAEVIPRFLEQGPPLNAPVEVRLLGDDLGAMAEVAAKVMGEMRKIEGTHNVRHDLGIGKPSVAFSIDDGAAARNQLSRTDVALALLKQTRGLPVGKLRAGSEPVAIVLRSTSGEEVRAETLSSLEATSNEGRPIPMAQVSTTKLRWRPAVITRKAQQRQVTISAQLADGYEFGPVTQKLQARLALAIPKDMKWSWGGSAEGSGDANSALLGAAPLGLLLLLLFILVEFNSFRRLAIILTTIPLAAAGVVPGLLIANQPFGFMSVLGILALIGVVVNNAIVLLSVIDARRKEGATVREALAAGVALRIRPILLTSATTVAGLLPLALSSSPLWPPMAAAMIAGLIASTLLALFVVPAMYSLLFSMQDRRKNRIGRLALPALVLLVIASASSVAQAENATQLNLRQVLAEAQNSPDLASAVADAAGARAAASLEHRAAFLPTIAISGSATFRDRDFTLATPMGDLAIGGKRALSGKVSISQPLLDVTRLFHSSRAAEHDAQAAELSSQRTADLVALHAAELYFAILVLEAQERANTSFTKSLRSRLSEVQSMVNAERAVAADVLRIDLALQDAQQQALVIEQQALVAKLTLGRALGRSEAVAAAPLDEAQISESSSGGARRPDLLALRSRKKAIDRRISAIRSELIPKIVLQGDAIYTDAGPQAEKRFFQGTINLVWVPYAAGSRAARRRIYEAERESVRHRSQHAERGVAVQVQQARANLVVAEGQLALSAKAVKQAQEAARIIGDRYRTGLETVSDVLEAEAIVRDSRSKNSIAGIARTQALLQLRFAQGLPLF